MSDLLDEYNEWIERGKTGASPHVIKELTILDYKENKSIFIETGTCHGDMVKAMYPYFKQLHSIELFEELYNISRDLLNKLDTIQLYFGNSKDILPKILKNIREPVIFWLDAHYSGEGTAKGDKETPIIEELDCILSHGFSHIILIDDARCFGTFPDYPTIGYVIEYVNEMWPNAVIEVKYDIIRIELKL